jgi:uncharacterized protein YkwD
MLKLLNDERDKVGLDPLIDDADLRKVARARSRDMFLRGYFGHIDPDGKDPGVKLRDEGISFTRAAENISYAPDFSTAHTGLMNSHEHRENILSPRFVKIGIGIVDGGKYGSIFTQLFTN